jgi:hypothetical protein
MIERIMKVAEFYRRTGRPLPLDLQTRMLSLGIDIRRFV